MSQAVRVGVAQVGAVGAPELGFRLAVNGHPVKDARSLESLKNAARALFQEVGCAEREEQVYQIYNDRYEVVLESRNNRQWRLVWKRPRKPVRLTAGA